MKKPLIITIGREYGSGGREIGEAVAKQLGIGYYDKKIITLAAEKSGLCDEFIANNEQRVRSGLMQNLAASAAYSSGFFSGQYLPLTDSIFIAEAQVIRDIAERESAVIVGRCADYILRDQPNVLRVFVHAPLDQRIRRAREEYGAAEDNLESYVIRQDKARASYHNYFAAGRWGQSREYDLCVNSRIGIDASVQVIQAAAQAMLEE